jgi:division protein CdvB (Snf7/Vps24/ESCRT-III family)
LNEIEHFAKVSPITDKGFIQMETQTIEEAKKIIMSVLPKPVETDPDIRSFILSVR